MKPAATPPVVLFPTSIIAAPGGCREDGVWGIFKLGGKGVEQAPIEIRLPGHQRSDRGVSVSRVREEPLVAGSVVVWSSKMSSRRSPRSSAARPWPRRPSWSATTSRSSTPSTAARPQTRHGRTPRRRGATYRGVGGFHGEGGTGGGRGGSARGQEGGGPVGWRARAVGIGRRPARPLAAGVRRPHRAWPSSVKKLTGPEVSRIAPEPSLPIQISRALPTNASNRPTACQAWAPCDRTYTSSTCDRPAEGSVLDITRQRTQTVRPGPGPWLPQVDRTRSRRWRVERLTPPNAIASAWHAHTRAISVHREEASRLPRHHVTAYTVCGCSGRDEIKRGIELGAGGGHPVKGGLSCAHFAARGGSVPSIK